MNYDDFNSWVDLNKICKVVKTINADSQFKGGASNFFKEKFLNLAIEEAQLPPRDKLKFVDKVDYDFESPFGKIESKSQKDLVFTQGGKTKQPTMRDRCCQFTLKNTNTKNDVGLNKTFDHLMLVQTSGVFMIGFVPYESLAPHIYKEPDKWVCRLPTNAIHIVHHENINGVNESNGFLDINDIFRLQIREIIG